MTVYTSRAQRSGSAIAAALVVAGLGVLLVLGLGGGLAAQRNASLLAVLLNPLPSEKPPEPKLRRRAPSSAATGAPAPANIKMQAAQVVAREVPPLLPPPPVPVATVSASGDAPANGAAPLPGPGQGAGGSGDGLGGGGSGGDGGGEPSVVGPRRIAGKLSMGDLPDGTIPPGVEASVTVLFRVGSDGRASECRADRSSGYPALDRIACRLIEHRFRYRPALSASGRPVASRVLETHSWYVEPEPPQRQ